MGMAITDTSTADVLNQFRKRFAPGHPLKEMVEIQREFRVFSPSYSLTQAFRLLHIVPADFKERRLWYRFLDDLRKYNSDKDGVTGHDRIRLAYQENLESGTPLPMFTTTHRADPKDMRVTITHGQPIIYETQEYVIISIPTIPASLSERAERRKKIKEELAKTP
jgi:hypothetical protein